MRRIAATTLLALVLILGQRAAAQTTETVINSCQDGAMTATASKLAREIKQQARVIELRRLAEWTTEAYEVALRASGEHH